MTGEFDSKRFQKQYGFLSDLYPNELKPLEGQFKKLLADSSRDFREEREQEVQRLKRAVKIGRRR